MAKQFSLSERILIEQMLNKDYSFASIGRNLDRSASTIAREVLHYRCFTDRIPLFGENDCINALAANVIPFVMIRASMAVLLPDVNAAQMVSFVLLFATATSLPNAIC